MHAERKVRQRVYNLMKLIRKKRRVEDDTLKATDEWRMEPVGARWNTAGDHWTTVQRLYGDFRRESRQQIEETGRADSRPMKFSARLESFRSENEEKILAYPIINIRKPELPLVHTND